MSEKPSLYLKNKCENLENTLKFFQGEKGNSQSPGKYHRMVFLSQIDFWDWEIEELIFSVKSFEERSKNWTNLNGMLKGLAKENILPKNDVLEVAFLALSDKAYNEERGAETKTIAPIKELNNTIKTWNKLIVLCEKSLIDRHVEKYGAVAVTDLGKFKKEEI